MKIKTNELTGAARDWAVATALGRGPKYNMESHGRTWREWWLAAPGHDYEPMPSYSTNWSQGGPIIEQWAISLSPDEFITGNTRWCAVCINEGEGFEQFGPTPLIAAMRCFVASKMGDEIDIPKELT